MESYLIKIDGVPDNGNNDEFREAVTSGIACQGFAMVLKVDDGYKVLLHSTNVKEMGDAISKSDELLAAATIGKAMREADEIMARAKMPNLLDLLKH